jgi:hypothetical protein
LEPGLAGSNRSDAIVFRFRIFDKPAERPTGPGAGATRQGIGGRIRLDTSRRLTAWLPFLNPNFRHILEEIRGQVAA